MARFSIRWKESDDDDHDIDTIEGNKPKYDTRSKQHYREENKKKCEGGTNTKRLVGGKSKPIDDSNSIIVPYHCHPLTTAYQSSNLYAHQQQHWQRSKKNTRTSLRKCLFIVKSLLVVLIAWFAKQNSTVRIVIERYTYHAWYSFTEAYYYAVEGIEDMYFSFTDRYTFGNSDTVCRLSLPAEVPESRYIPNMEGIAPVKQMSPTEAWLNDELVGQKLAASIIATALEGWTLQDEGYYHNEVDKRKIEAHSSPVIPENSRAIGIKKRPISLMLMGPPGTGKAMTTFLLSQWLFHNCSSSSAGANRGILMLHGEDFVDERQQLSVGETWNLVSNHNTNNGNFGKEEIKHNEQVLNAIHYGHSTPLSAREKLQRRIVDFLKRRRGRGSLIVINGIEKIHGTVLNALSELFETSTAETSCLSYYDERRRKHVGITSCGPVLVIFTTHLGTDRIFRIVREHHGRDSVPRAVIETTLREVMKRHWNGTLNVEKYFHSLVPFLPLGHVEVEEIVHRQCKKLSDEYAHRLWKRLDVTNEARQRLVGTDFLEYVDLRKNSRDNLHLIVSRHGASSIDSGPMQVLRSKLRRYLYPYRPDQIAVFNYSIDKGTASVQWCEERADENSRSQISKHICETTWEGPIDA